MNEKKVLECKFHDYMPTVEIISEISQSEYQAKKAGKTSKFNNQNSMQDSQEDEEYLIGGWDVIDITPTKRINRNKTQLTTQQRILQIEKDRVTEKMNRSRGFF
jgi:hypothetical protein